MLPEITLLVRYRVDVVVSIVLVSADPDLWDFLQKPRTPASKTPASEIAVMIAMPTLLLEYLFKPLTTTRRNIAAVTSGFRRQNES